MHRSSAPRPLRIRRSLAGGGDVAGDVAGVLVRLCDEHRPLQDGVRQRGGAPAAARPLLGPEAELLPEAVLSAVLPGGQGDGCNKALHRGAPGAQLHRAPCPRPGARPPVRLNRRTSDGPGSRQRRVR
eukprot:6388672-Pyramimonas_sp.AAC.1